MNAAFEDVHVFYAQTKICRYVRISSPGSGLPSRSRENKNSKAGGYLCHFTLLPQEAVLNPSEWEGRRMEAARTMVKPWCSLIMWFLKTADRPQIDQPSK